MDEQGLGDVSMVARERRKTVRLVKYNIIGSKLKWITDDHENFLEKYSHWISVVKTRNHALPIE